MPVQIDTSQFRETQGGPMVYTVRWRADTEEEAATGIPYVFKRVLILTDKSASQWHPDAQKFLVTAQYEGLLNDPPSDMDEFSVDGEFREEKIESFPFRQMLEEEYGAFEKNGRLEFPRLRPKKSNTTTGVKPPNGQEADEENPLFNVRTYPVFYETASWRFKRKRLPSFVNRLPGSVVDTLPAGFEYDGDTAQWFITKAPRYKRGGCWTVSVHYKGIDKIRHVAALQELINQAGGEGGGGLGGTSLSTGGLSTGTLS